MAAHDATHDVTELPIACSLDAAELGARERRWTNLVRSACTVRRATADGVELRFGADERTEHELYELVAAERECCAWARWELRNEDGDLVMHAQAAGDTATAALQSMFLRDA